jgi:hypothetical protein
MNGMSNKTTHFYSIPAAGKGERERTAAGGFRRAGEIKPQFFSLGLLRALPACYNKEWRNA